MGKAVNKNTYVCDGFFAGIYNVKGYVARGDGFKQARQALHCCQPHCRVQKIQENSRKKKKKKKRIRIDDYVCANPEYSSLPECLQYNIF